MNELATTRPDAAEAGAEVLGSEGEEVDQGFEGACRE